MARRSVSMVPCAWPRNNRPCGNGRGCGSGHDRDSPLRSKACRGHARSHKEKTAPHEFIEREIEMKASEVKKGNVVEHNNNVYQVRDIERSAAQGRSGNITFRFIMYSVPGGNKFDLSLRSEDEIKEVELVRREATFSYKDGEAFVFLDAEDFTPYQLDADVVG